MAYGSVLPASVDAPAARKGRGAFFTPPQLAELVVRECVTGPDDRVLDPSCGEAEFLVASARRLVSLGADTAGLAEGLRGFELHGPSAHAARERLAALDIGARIDEADFFSLPPDASFSAVVGNPPYVRYQGFSGEQRRRALDAARAAGVRLSALCSSWAPFLVHATRFLRPGGSLGMVLPAELLTSNYAAPVRDFLLDSFPSLVVTMFDSRVFPEVQEEVVALVARGFGMGSSHAIEVRQAGSVAEASHARVMEVEVRPGERWLITWEAVRAEDALALPRAGATCTLGDYAAVRLGAVSGANSFFALSPETARAWGLQADDLLPLCPPGSRHLRRLSLDGERLARLGRAGGRIWLFRPGEHPGPHARAYIRHGEELGLNETYKCRSRSPWWDVPGIARHDLFLTYMNGDGPNLCLNEAGACCLNSVHGVTLREGVPGEVSRLLPVAALSSLTLLSAEMVGRSYGGGMLKIEPREALRLLLPAPAVLESCADDLLRVAPEADQLLAHGRRVEASATVDGVLGPAMGLDSSTARELADALERLKRRRRMRGRPARVS